MYVFQIGFESAHLTPILLTWKILWAPNNAGRWQKGFNWAFKGLKKFHIINDPTEPNADCHKYRRLTTIRDLKR